MVESRLALDETIVETGTDAYNTTTQVDGLAPTTKRKGKKKQDSNKSKAKAKARSKTKVRENTSARKGRKEFTKWRETPKRKTHKAAKMTQNGRT